MCICRQWFCNHMERFLSLPMTLTTNSFITHALSYFLQNFSCNFSTASAPDTTCRSDNIFALLGGYFRSVNMLLVDKILPKTFCRHNISSTQHFVEAYFVENFSSTEHFVDTALRRHNISSTGHFTDRIRGSIDDYNRIILVL